MKVLRATQRSHTSLDEQLIPVGAILIEQKNRFSGGSDPRVQTGGLNLHERDQAVYFRLSRREFGKDAPQAQSVFAESGTRPVITRGCGIAFVENEIDDFQNRRKPRREIGSARDLKGDTLFRESAFRTHDALGHGRFGDEEGARNLVGSQASQQAQRQRDSRFGGENRMAGSKDEAQQVIA